MYMSTAPRTTRKRPAERCTVPSGGCERVSSTQRQLPNRELGLFYLQNFTKLGAFFDHTINHTG